MQQYGFQMETGQFGLHGVHVVLLVEMEIKPKPERVPIHHLPMGAKTAVYLIQKQ